jgi:predicted enzyme involved in methoxymalonyl-ACP biosynthesis
LNKTNQFNTTGRRWTIEELREALAADRELQAFEVSDTYTRYGLVGVVIMHGAVVEQFVMSCRVVGLDVELAAIASLARRVAARTAASRIRAITRETDANLLSRDLWLRCGFEWCQDGWEAPIAEIVDIPTHIAVHTEAVFMGTLAGAAD